MQAKKDVGDLEVFEGFRCVHYLVEGVLQVLILNTFQQTHLVRIGNKHVCDRDVHRSARSAAYLATFFMAGVEFAGVGGAEG